MRLALAAVAGLAAFAAACGGVENEANFATAAERTEATGSVRIEMTSRLGEPGSEFEMRCAGAADYERHRFRMVCEPAQAPEGRSMPFEWREIGSTVYEKAGDLGAEKQWTESTNDESDQSGSELSPEKMLDLLRSASRQTERVGEELVRGEETVRYALAVDCEAAELGDCAGETAVADVWIDGRGLVRRIRMELGPDGEAQVEFFDFGAEVEIEPPPADHVSEEPSPHGRCTDGDATPISVKQAIEVLRRHGFDTERDTFLCAPGVVGSLSSGFDKPDLLACSVLTKPRGEGPSTTVFGDISSGGSALEPVERGLENLWCTLFVEERRRNEAVERFDAAFAELKRAVDP
jgi:hypothetical protein